MNIFIEKEKNFVNEKKYEDIYIIWLNNGKFFRGKSKCAEEDRENYSFILGGEIAYLRAYKKFIKYKIKNINLFSDENIEELKKELDNIDLTIENSIKNFYKGKERVKKYKERKTKGLLSPKQKFEKQIEELLKLKK